VIGHLAYRLIPLVATAVLAVAAWVLYQQPDKKPLGEDILIGLAALLATILSLGFTVALLVAQHLAENHGRALYAEYRRDWSWMVALAGLASGTVLIAALALQESTRSSGFGSILLIAGFALAGFWLFPSLLDSLDRVVLANRIADRHVARVKAVAAMVHPFQRQPVLAPVAVEGIDLCAGLAQEGIDKNDVDVLKAGLAGARRISIAYLAAIPTSISMGTDEAVGELFQQFDVLVGQAAAKSPVLALPAAIEELDKLGVEAAAVPNRLNPDYDPIQMPLLGLLLRVALATTTIDNSSAVAMATSAIGNSGEALAERRRLNGLSDNISKLRRIGLEGVRTGRGHIVNVACAKLCRIALVVAHNGVGHVMGSDMFDQACRAFKDIATTFAAENGTGNGRLLDDSSLSYVLAGLSRQHVAAVVVAGLDASKNDERVRIHDYSSGLWSLYEGCLLLARQNLGIMTSRDALETAYWSLASLMIFPPDDQSWVRAWWDELWGCLLESGDPDRPSDRMDIAASLLYLAVQAPPKLDLRPAIVEILEKMASPTDTWQAGRLARVWVPACLCALANGDESLARQVIERFRSGWSDLAADRGDPVSSHWLGFRPYVPVFGMELVKLPLPGHGDWTEAASQFDGLLNAGRQSRAVKPATRGRRTAEYVRPRD
jgi:hypothetical protein